MPSQHGVRAKRGASESAQQARTIQAPHQYHTGVIMRLVFSFEAGAARNSDEHHDESDHNLQRRAAR